MSGATLRDAAWNVIFEVLTQSRPDNAGSDDNDKNVDSQDKGKWYSDE
jgi:hypothetical protein